MPKIDKLKSGIFRYGWFTGGSGRKVTSFPALFPCDWVGEALETSWDQVGSVVPKMAAPGRTYDDCY